MATYYSTEQTNFLPPSNLPMDPQDSGGVIRLENLSYTVPTAGNAIGDIILGNIIPQGARIVYANLAYQALGASSTIQVGGVGQTTGTNNAGQFSGAVSTSSAGNTVVANTIALGFGQELSEPTQLQLVVAGGALTAATQIELVVLYTTI
jgi:hypothetical protein